MRKLLAVLMALTIWALAIPASATVDLGNGFCAQDDGAQGVWDGTTADDEGCVTEAEYVASFGVEALDLIVAVGPDPEPNAPTVRERLFPKPTVAGAMTFQPW